VVKNARKRNRHILLTDEPFWPRQLRERKTLLGFQVRVSLVRKAPIGDTSEQIRDGARVGWRWTSQQPPSASCGMGALMVDHGRCEPAPRSIILESERGC
jgi:hypothetical protein